MEDDFSTENLAAETAKSWRLTRRRFLQASAAVPITAAAVDARNASQKIQDGHERDLAFQFLEGQRKVRVIVLFDTPGDQSQTLTATDEPIQWTIDARRFGPQAYFTLRELTESGRRKRYELRIRNGQFGALQQANLVWDLEQRKDPESGKLRFSIVAETDFFRRSNERLGFFLEDYGNPFRVRRTQGLFARLFERRSPRPRPGRFRDFARGQSRLHQIVNANVVPQTFAGMFNGLIKYNNRSGSIREIDISIGTDLFWDLENRNFPKQDQVYIASIRLALKSLRFGWMSLDTARSGDAKDADDPTKYQLFARAVRDDNTRFGLFGGTGPTISFEQTGGPKGKKDDSPGVFLLRRDDTRADGESRAEAALPGYFNFDIADKDEPETMAGPFRDIVGRILLRADRSAKRNTVDFSLSFDGDFATTKARRIETPIGPLVVRGPTLSPEAEAETPEARRQRIFLDPFAARWDQGVSLIWSEAQSSKRELDWAEINVLLLEHAAALSDSHFSRLTFDPTDLRILWAPTEATDDSASLVSLLRLGPRSSIPGSRIDLSRATLRAARTNDLLSLQFRFSGLWLAYGATGAPELVKDNPACSLPLANGKTRDDPRPVIAVDFPGQHLFEEALFIPKSEPLPDAKLEEERGVVSKANGKLNTQADDPPAVLQETETEFILKVNDAAQVDEVLRRLPTTAMRKTFREALQIRKSAADAKFQTFQKAYRAAAENHGKRVSLPPDQKIYIGNFGLDVDARALARQVQNEQRRQKAAEFYSNLIARLKTTYDEILKDARSGGNTSPEAIALTDIDTSISSALVMEGLLEQSIPAYQLLREFYRDVMIGTHLEDGLAQNPDAEFWPKDTKAEETEAIFAILGEASPTLPGWASAAGLKLDHLVQRRDAVKEAFTEAILKQDEQDQINRQTRNGLVEGRLANPSRLAFRVACADWTEVLRATKTHLDQPDDAQARLPRKTLPFTLQGLTNFADFELAVTRRAQRIYSADEAGRRDRLSRRTLNVSPGAMLDHLGFHDGPFVNSSTRLADIQSALRAPPGPFETAIEIPARLILSPHQDAVVIGRNTGDVPDSVFAQDERRQPDVSALWSADFLIEAEDPGVRAVHSPDLRSDFLWGHAYSNKALPGAQRIPATPPPRGPTAPWHHGQGAQPIGRADLTLVGPGDHSIADLNDTEDPLRRWNLVIHPQKKQTFGDRLAQICKAFADQKKAGDPEKPEQFRGPTDAFIRHELVLLTSGWGLPVLGRRAPTGNLMQGSSQVEPEPRHRLFDLQRGSALYQPRALEVTELSLSSLGGSLRHDSSFEPPAAALSQYEGQSGLFDALSIERWQQWTVLSRDVFCEVTFKGFLFPLGHRAALVQVTEREFLRAPDGTVRAYLRQRMFIRLGKPEKRFPAIAQPFEGRLFPVERLRILTTQTPDIVDPATLVSTSPPDGDGPVPTDSYGRLNLPKKSALAFWPRTAPLSEANIRFEIEIDGAKTDIPLIFVDNIAANDPASLARIVATYNAMPSPDDTAAEITDDNSIDPVVHVRTMQFRGEKRRYAPELKAGSTSLETDHWTLAAGGRRSGAAQIATSSGLTGKPIKAFVPTLAGFSSDPILQGADQPPFFPQVDVARLRLRQAERLVGRTYGPVRARFDFAYLQKGFPERPPGEVIESNAGEIFLTLVEPDQKLQSMGKKGDQSGGVFRPSGRMVAVSRAKGVVSNTGRLAVPITGGFAEVAEVFNHGPMPPPPPAQTGAAAAPQPAEQKAKAQEALRRAREIYANLFDSKAKILGLVSLKDLVSFLDDLENPNTGMPELDEQIRYGAGQMQGALDELKQQATDAGEEVENQINETVDNLTGEVRQQASDAADLVQVQVVKPLSVAVRDIRKGWDALEAQLAEEQRIVAPAQIRAITIREIFPELDSSLKALDFALTDSANQSDQIAFALSLGAVYEAGRRFIDALQRSLSNPAARIEDAFRSRFDALREVFDGVAQGLPGIVRALAADVLAAKRRELAEKLALRLVPVSTPTAFLFPAVRIPDIDLLAEIGVNEALITEVRAALSLEPQNARALIGNFIDFALDPKNFAQLPADGEPAAQLLRLFLRQDTYRNVLGFSISPILRRPHGQQISNLINSREARIRAAVEQVFAALEKKVLDLEADLQNATDETRAAIEAELTRVRAEAEARAAELRVILHTLVGQEIDALIETISREFAEEIAVITEVVTKTEKFVRAVKSGAPRPILDASLELVAVFAGPLDFETEDVCVAANRFAEPLRRALLYFNPEELILSDPKAIGVPVVLTREDLPLPTSSGATQDVPVRRAPKLEMLTESTLGTRLHDAHHDIHAALLKGASGLDDAVTDLLATKEKAPKAADQIDTVVAKLRSLVGPALRQVARVNDALARSYRDLVNADRAAVILRARLKSTSEIDLCGPNIATQLDAAARLPRDLQAFIDVYDTLVKTLVEAVGDIGKATENLLRSDLSYVVLTGLLADQLDKKTGVFQTIKDEAGEVAKTAQSYARQLQRLEYKTTVYLAGVLRTVVAQIEKQVASARALVKHINELSEDDRVREFVDVSGIEQNLAQIDKALVYLGELNTELTRIAAIKIPDYDDQLADDAQPQPGGPRLTELQKAIGDGPPALDFVSPEVAPNEQNQTLGQLRELQSQIEAQLRDITAKLRQRLHRAESDVLKQVDGLAKQILNAPVPFGDNTVSLPQFYKNAVEERDNLIAKTPKILADSLKTNIVSDPRKHHAKLEIPAALPAADPPLVPYEPAPEGDLATPANDALAGDRAWLAYVSQGAPLSDPVQRRYLIAFLNEWSREDSAPIIIGNQIVSVISDILRGDIMRLIDLNAIRDQIEDYLLSLVPSEIQMRYGYGVVLGDPVRKATGGIFAPASGSRLDVRTGIVIRLNQFQPEIAFSSVGTLGAFDVKLVGDAFDALTLRFKGARFETKGGSKPRFDISYDDYIIGPQLQFLQQLQSILSPSEGSGAFILPRFGLPGIEAGYSMNLGVFSIGAASFFNIALRTSAILPFGDGDARFRAALSSRTNPFTISYLPFGGSGFFAIEANANGILGFEASFEFGGAAAFGFGPLTGQGRLMSGIYVRQTTLSQNRKLTEITGTFYVGGSARIWIFGFGASLYVRLGMVNGDMSGEAVFTYSFSIGIKDFDFSVQVWKQEAEGFNGQSTSIGAQGKTRFAQLGDKSTARIQDRNAALVQTKTSSPDTNYRAYRNTYFKKPLKGEDFF